MNNDDTRGGSGSAGWIQRIASPRPVALIWAGILIGIAFIEQPARFGAPEVTYAIALDIGRVVFQTLNRVEIALVVLLALFAWASRARVWSWAVVAAVAGIVAAQSLWLLPELSARAITLAGGGSVTESAAHVFYTVLELGKLVALAVIGLFAD